MLAINSGGSSWTANRVARYVDPQITYTARRDRASLGSTAGRASVEDEVDASMSSKMEGSRRTAQRQRGTVWTSTAILCWSRHHDLCWSGSHSIGTLRSWWQRQGS